MLEKLKVSKIILDYCQNNKYADREFVYKICDVIVKSRKYQEYVTNVDFLENNPESKSGVYSQLERRISILLPDINQNIIRYNFSILQSILHEFEHVNQFNIVDNKNASLKRAILTSCLPNNGIDIFGVASINKLNNSGLVYDEKKYEKKLKEEIKKMYHELYLYAPFERMANIDSYKYINDILSKYKFREYCDEKDEYLSEFYLYNLVGYDIENGKIECPTFNFFNKIDTTNFLDYKDNLIEFLKSESKKMSLYDRLYYGLPINHNELLDVMKKIKI